MGTGNTIKNCRTNGLEINVRGYSHIIENNNILLNADLYRNMNERDTRVRYGINIIEGRDSIIRNNRIEGGASGIKFRRGALARVTRNIICNNAGLDIIGYDINMDGVYDDNTCDSVTFNSGMSAIRELNTACNRRC